MFNFAFALAQTRKCQNAGAEMADLRALAVDALPAGFRTCHTLSECHKSRPFPEILPILTLKNRAGILEPDLFRPLDHPRSSLTVAKQKRF